MYVVVNSIHGQRRYADASQARDTALLDCNNEVYVKAIITAIVM